MALSEKAKDRIFIAVTDRLIGDEISQAIDAADLSSTAIGSSGASKVGVADEGEWILGPATLEASLEQLGSTLSAVTVAANRRAANVPVIANPGAATATDVANKINAVIQALVAAGLMTGQN